MVRETSECTGFADGKNLIWLAEKAYPEEDLVWAHNDMSQGDGFFFGSRRRQTEDAFVRWGLHPSMLLEAGRIVLA